jgi:hypothetical protein
VELGSARELKAQLMRDMRGSVRVTAQAEPRTIAVGVVPRPRGFAVALRVSSADALSLPVVEDALRRWGDETDVRVVGLVRAATGAAPGRPGAPERPLRPGASVAHPDVTAGTLGAFGRDAAGRVVMVSNNHVLADTDRARLGDGVLSPGPADGGRPDRDRVATLTSFERLSAAGNLLDLAVASLDDPATVGGNTVPEGELSGVAAELLDGVPVAKVGRTTGHTTGSVTAVELDGVTVDYGRGDLFTFDDCLEVEGDAGAFSAGGDSGSIVYERDGREAVGLLFAGSTTGGAGGAGLTFCNPAELALRVAGVTLL